MAAWMVAEEVSVEAAVAAVLSVLDGIFSLKTSIFAGWALGNMFWLYPRLALARVYTAAYCDTPLAPIGSLHLQVTVRTGSQTSDWSTPNVTD